MNFVDSTLVRLAVPSSRIAILTGKALERIAGAAYDASALTLEGPYSPVFEEFRLGFISPRRATVEGGWSTPGGARHDLLLEVTGLGTGPVLRIDALWRGAVLARAVPGTSPIDVVSTTLPSIAGIDEAIVADLGALPADATSLEAERRARYLARLRADLHQPATLSEVRLDRLLASVGASSVGELIEQPGVRHVGSVRVHFAPPTTSVPVPRQLPVAVAIFVRPAGFSVAELLWETRLALQELERSAFTSAPVSDLPRRRALVALWVVPEAVFDDAHWPGGEGVSDATAARALRLEVASAWLMEEGIALATTAVV